MRSQEMSIFLLFFSSWASAAPEDSFDIEESFLLLPETITATSSFTHVQNGSFQFFLTADCLQIITEPSPFGIDGSCWAQNPDAPYGLIMLPTHNGEVADSYTGYPVTNNDGMSATWHLRPNDVIILLGRTPPTCSYFSFTNYLYSRYSPPGFEPDPSVSRRDGHACLPGSENERCEYFASISDTVNLDRGLNLPGGEDGGDKFNASFAFVLSPSDTAAALATRALVEAKVPHERISNFTFPGSELNLGDESTADTFTTLLRTAFYEDEGEKEQFFSQVPFKILRMELQEGVDNQLHAPTPYIPRDTGARTDGTAAGLNLDEMVSAVRSLAAAVLQTLTTATPGTPTATATSSASTAAAATLSGGEGGVVPSSADATSWEVAVSVLESGAPDTGDECVALGQRCLADCRDTLYPFSLNEYDRSALCDAMVTDRLVNSEEEGGGGGGGDDESRRPSLRDDVLCTEVESGLLSPDRDDTMVVVGVNHKLSNMSAYASLAVYDLETLWGVAGVGDGDLAGTAEAYVTAEALEDDPLLAKALPFLYAYRIKRHCGAEDLPFGCLSIPYEASLDKQVMIPLAHPVGFAERMYDNPISHVGPSVDEVAMPVLIHTKRR